MNNMFVKFYVNSISSFEVTAF